MTDPSDSIRDTIQGSRNCDIKIEVFKEHLANAMEVAKEIRDSLMQDDVSLLSQYELELLRESIRFSSELSETLDDNPDSINLE